MKGIDPKDALVGAIVVLMASVMMVTGALRMGLSAIEQLSVDNLDWIAQCDRAYKVGFQDGYKQSERDR